MMNNRISVNEPGFEISLFSTHTLDNGNTEITLPRLIDSQFINKIDFTFSGTVDHSTKIPPADMLRSSAVQSFFRYLTIARLPLVYQLPSQNLIDSALKRTETTLVSPISSLTTTPPVFPKVRERLLQNFSQRSNSRSVSVTPSCRYSFHTDAHVLSIHLAYNWKSLSQSSAGI
jgi:hypothetical protein